MGPTLDRTFGIFHVAAEGDRGVKAEESEYAGHAILNFHGSLPMAKGVILDDVRSDEGSHGAIGDGRVRVVLA